MGKRTNRHPKIEKNCLNCGKKMVLLWARRQRKYCSKRCNNLDKKGEKHNWHPKTEFKKGYIPKWSKKSREKASKSHLGKKIPKEQIKRQVATLKKVWDKKGRKKYKRYLHLCWTKKYKQWRSGVFQRDNWTCQTCEARSSEGNPVCLEAHHIKSWKDYPKLRYKIENGITLCKDCHNLISGPQKDRGTNNRKTGTKMG